MVLLSNICKISITTKSKSKEQVFPHNGDSASMDGTELGFSEHGTEPSLGYFLDYIERILADSSDSVTLLLKDLHDHPLERCFEYHGTVSIIYRCNLSGQCRAF